MDSKSFFAALWADWVARMSGTGSIFLLAVGVWLPTIPRWLVFLVAVICFVMAAIRIWTTEHRRATRLQNALTEVYVECARPHFSIIRQ
jgi:hypothetical protein